MPQALHLYMDYNVESVLQQMSSSWVQKEELDLEMPLFSWATEIQLGQDKWLSDTLLSQAPWLCRPSFGGCVSATAPAGQG